jgi:thymidylate synthase (FAD)
MIVRLVGRMEFVGLPEELGTPLPTQLCGPDAQKIIEVAGRTCYDSFGKGRDSDAFAEHLMEAVNPNPTYHSTFVFYIDGVSRGESHEHVRHHVGCSPSQRSSRYCDESTSPWIPHPLFTVFMEENPTDALGPMWNAHVESGRRLYRAMVGKLQPFAMEKSGGKMSATDARKQARGAARGALGNALETALVWSGNVEAIRCFIDKRACAGADAEIRAVAIEILKIMKVELPIYFPYTIRDSPDGIGQIAVLE